MGLGKTLLIILGVVFFLIILVAGVTVYQIYDFYNTTQEESSNYPQDEQEFRETFYAELMEGNCSRIYKMDESMNKIKAKAERLCANPIIRLILKDNEDFDCNNMEEFDAGTTGNFSTLKEMCDNGTIEQIAEHNKQINSS